MMKKMKVKTYLVVSFVIILAMMTVLGAASAANILRLANQTISFYESAHTVQVEVGEVRKIMSDIGSLLRRAIIYQNHESNRYSRDAIQEDVTQMSGHIALVKERFAGDPQLLTPADTAVGAWLAEIDKINALMDEDRYDEAEQVFSGTYQQLEEAVNSAVLALSNHSAQDSAFYYDQAKRSKAISLAVISAMVIAAIGLSVYICGSIIKGITVPLAEVCDAADAMSRGNLSYPLTYEAENEFGRLVRSIRNTEETLASYVNNIDHVLHRMAQNDLTVRPDMQYVGDFAAIRESLNLILISMNHAMTQIRRSSEQVNASAEQVSDSAQVLSHGATEQASSMEQLADNLSSISAQVERNAQNTEQTHELVDRVGGELEQGNRQMRQMLDAMAEINRASDQIAKIIKTIEDIAFQTNILALNAAVEAARAGAAGKGFAVVADEVRNLASKSAEAAKSTTELIQDSIRAVQNGTRIADSTASTLGGVVSSARDITEKVSMISKSSDEQAHAISKINEVVGQISEVIITNSATSQESAAASEEMSGQAGILNNLVGGFQLLPMEQCLASAPPALRAKPEG